MTSLLLAFGVTAVATLLISALARRRGWVSHSVNAKGNHPALLGGVAVVLGMLASLLIYGEADAIGTLYPLWIPAAIMFSLGLCDDFLHLRPPTKFAIQIVAIFTFLWLLKDQRESPSFFWSALLFFWILGITNALNLLDNMDGITPGVAAIAAVFLAILLPQGMTHLPVILFALAGSLAGFLLFNFQPASIYLGDAGTYLVGFILAAAPVAALGPDPRAALHLLAMPVVLLVPICDTTFVTFSRWRRGISPTQGGKDHLSHQLKRRGMGERIIAALFYAAALLCGIAALVMDRFRV